MAQYTLLEDECLHTIAVAYYQHLHKHKLLDAWCAFMVWVLADRGL